MEQFEKSDFKYTSSVFCKHCFCTLDEFLETGFVGCEYCYNAFENQINKYISSTQYGNNHIGKMFLKKGNNDE